MYGFSGYGTNSYGSERQSSFLAQVVRLGARVFRDVYGAAIAFARTAGRLSITNVYGSATAFSRPNSSRTFNDPSQSQTLKLPA